MVAARSRRTPSQLLTVALALTTCAASLILLAPSVGAEEGEGAGDGVSEALLEDAARAAETSGEHEADMVDRVAFQDRMNQVMDPIILANYDIYAEAGFDGDESAYIAFTAPLPAAARAELAQHPEITVIEDAVLSTDEADVMMADVFGAVVEGAAGDTTSTVHVDPVSGDSEIVTSKPLSEATVQATKSRASSHASDRAKARSASPVVTFEVDQTLAMEAAAVRGGDKMTLPYGSDLMCTAGFPVKVNGKPGLLTAGHCRDRLSVDGGDKLYDKIKEKNGLTGDVQFHVSKVTVTPYFRYDWGQYRPVWAHPVMKVGTEVCRFGARTGPGTQCTTVKYLSSCAYYNNRDYCKLSMTHRYTGTLPGDSGGPWYMGNNAYGLTSAYGSRDGYMRDWFYQSRLVFYDDNFTPMYGPR
jgi:streptogrisin C